LIRSGSAPDFRASLPPVPELAIDLDRNGGGAPHRQIQTWIRERIRSGAVSADVARPPALALAAELSVARGVVIEAYAQLVAEGYLTSRSGGVHRWHPRRPPRRRPPHPRPGRPGRPVALASPRDRLRLQPLQPRRFPRAAWLRPVRRVPRPPTSVSATSTAAERWNFGRQPPPTSTACGITNADPETIAITNGYAQATSPLIGVLATRGARTRCPRSRKPSPPAGS
jgi:GntR family transcriptional regulator / MocR family aminotransferase